MIYFVTPAGSAGYPDPKSEDAQSTINPCDRSGISVSATRSTSPYTDSVQPYMYILVVSDRVRLKRDFYFVFSTGMAAKVAR